MFHIVSGAVFISLEGEQTKPGTSSSVFDHHLLIILVRFVWCNQLSVERTELLIYSTRRKEKCTEKHCWTNSLMWTNNKIVHHVSLLSSNVHGANISRKFQQQKVLMNPAIREECVSFYFQISTKITSSWLQQKTWTITTRKKSIHYSCSIYWNATSEWKLVFIFCCFTIKLT